MNKNAIYPDFLPETIHKAKNPQQIFHSHNLTLKTIKYDWNECIRDRRS